MLDPGALLVGKKYDMEGRMDCAFHALLCCLSFVSCGQHASAGIEVSPDYECFMAGVWISGFQLRSKLHVHGHNGSFFFKLARSFLKQLGELYSASIRMVHEDHSTMHKCPVLPE